MEEDYLCASVRGPRNSALHEGVHGEMWGLAATSEGRLEKVILVQDCFVSRLSRISDFLFLLDNDHKRSLLAFRESFGRLMGKNFRG